MTRSGVRREHHHGAVREADAVRPKRRSSAAVLLAVGALAAGAHASASSITKEQVELFRGFYQGSIESFFEVIDRDLLNLPMREFDALPRESKRPACLVIVDHTTYRSFMLRSFHAAHGRQSILEFMKRAKDSGGFLFRDLKTRFEALSDKAKHCLLAGVVQVGSVGFTEDHADTLTEFQLRDLYRSQVPFVRWVLDSAPASQERDDLEVIIRSMERKYLLNLAGPQAPRDCQASTGFGTAMGGTGDSRCDRGLSEPSRGD